MNHSPNSTNNSKNNSKNWLGGLAILGFVLGLAWWQLRDRRSTGDSSSNLDLQENAVNQVQFFGDQAQKSPDRSQAPVAQPGVETSPPPQDNLFQKTVKKSDLDLRLHSEQEIQKALKQTLEFSVSQIPALIALVQQGNEEETVVRATTALGALVTEAPARSFLLQMMMRAESPDLALKAAANGLSNKIEVFDEIPKTFNRILKNGNVPSGAKTVVLESLTRYELMSHGLAFDRSPEAVARKKAELFKIENPEVRASVLQTLGISPQ